MPKLVILPVPMALPKGLPPNPPPKPLDGPFSEAKGDVVPDLSPLPKLKVGVGAAGFCGGLAASDANGEGEDEAPPPPPPPKTLLFAPNDANGDAVEEASLEKPDAAKAEAEAALGCVSFSLESVAASLVSVTDFALVFGGDA